MDTPKNDHQHPEGCKCNKCMWLKSGNMWGNGYYQHNWPYHVLRWFFGLAIIIIVFCVGIQIGELKGILENGGGFRSHNVMQYNRPMMGMYGSSGGNYGYRTVNGQSTHAPIMKSATVDTPVSQ
jgi:hypothetical protein